MPNALERKNRADARKAQASPATLLTTSPATVEQGKKANPNEFATSLQDYDRKKAQAQEPEGLTITNAAPTPAQEARKTADDKRKAESEAHKKAQAESSPKGGKKASGSPQDAPKAPEATPVAPTAPKASQEPTKVPESTPPKAPATPAKPVANLLDDENRKNLALLLEAAQAEKETIKTQNDELLKLIDSHYAALELTQKNMVRLEVAKAINLATLTLLKKLHDATK